MLKPGLFQYFPPSKDMNCKGIGYPVYQNLKNRVCFCEIINYTK